jgi:site-specific recombinase XerD
MRKQDKLLPLYITKYEPLALRSRRPNTRRLYRTTLRFFERFLERPATLADLTDDTVSAFAAWRLGHGLAKGSVNKDLFNLLALWRWLHKKGYIANWPDVELEVPSKRSPGPPAKLQEQQSLHVSQEKNPASDHDRTPGAWRQFDAPFVA